MRRSHGGALRIHPTNNDLKHLRRCVRLNFYRQDDSTVDQLVVDLDDDSFAAVLSNDQRVLRCILPERNTRSYSLRPRRHELSISISISFFYCADPYCKTQGALNSHHIMCYSEQYEYARLKRNVFRTCIDNQA